MIFRPFPPPGITGRSAGILAESRPSLKGVPMALYMYQAAYTAESMAAL
jgi:hypothetical protein